LGAHSNLLFTFITVISPAKMGGAGVPISSVKSVSVKSAGEGQHFFDIN